MDRVNKVIFHASPAPNPVAIDEGHVLHERYLDNIRETCPHINSLEHCEHCSNEKHASCKGRLHSLLIYGIEVAEDHFIHEEAMMLRNPDPNIQGPVHQAHIAAHNAILKKLETVNAMCAELNRNVSTADAYRNLYHQTFVILDEHDRLFDKPLVRKTKYKTKLARN